MEQKNVVNSSHAVQKATQAIEKNAGSVSIETMIKNSISQLKLALPKHMSAERIVRIALTTLRMNPKLYQCSGQSFLAALFQSAQLGLEPNLNGESWIIPYKLKTGETAAQFQIGAYGLVKLFWNHQNSVSIQVEAVHEKDTFEYDLGSSIVKHIPPAFNQERGKVVGYYAYGTLQNGGHVLKVMSIEEALEHGRKFSKCYDRTKKEFYSGTPWKDHFDAMAKKTVLIQLMKLLPKSVEIQRALAADETIKTKIEGDMLEVPNEVPYEDISDEDDIVNKDTGAISEDNPVKILLTPPVKPTPDNPLGLPPPNVSFIAIVNTLKKEVPAETYERFIKGKGIKDVALLTEESVQNKFIADLKRLISSQK